MATEKTLQRSTGVEWIAHGDGRFKPLYKWKSISFTGNPRSHKAFHPGEREAALRYMSNRIGEYLFGTPPMIVLDSIERGVTTMPNPAWDELPVILKDDAGREYMSDGSDVPS